MQQEIDHLRSKENYYQNRINSLQQRAFHAEMLVHQNKELWLNNELDTVEEFEVEEGKQEAPRLDALADVSGPEVEALKEEIEKLQKQLDQMREEKLDLETKISSQNIMLDDMQLMTKDLEAIEKAERDAKLVEESKEVKQALRIAQSTVASLRERLEQKEMTLRNFDDLLQDCRTSAQEEVMAKQKTILELQDQIRSAQLSLMEAQETYARAPLNEVADEVLNKQSRRINELEDDLKDAMVSVQELTAQLACSKEECSRLVRTIESQSKEQSELKDQLELKVKLVSHQFKQEMEKMRNEKNAIVHENMLLQEDVHNMRETHEQEPSVILKSLVEKLRNDLAEKEKKQRSMSRAIAELKEELVKKAKDPLDEDDELARRIGSNDLSLKKMDELLSKSNHLAKQNKLLKDRDVFLHDQITNLKEDISKRGSHILKLKDENLQMTNEMKNKLQMFEKEKKQLKKRILILENKVREVQNQPEKPLESKPTSLEIENTAKLATWNEAKKHEMKINQLKTKIQTYANDISKLTQTNISLRGIIDRSEREKKVLQKKYEQEKKQKAKVMAELEANISKPEAMSDNVGMNDNQIDIVRNKLNKNISRIEAHWQNKPDSNTQLGEVNDLKKNFDIYSHYVDDFQVKVKNEKLYLTNLEEESKHKTKLLTEVKSLLKKAADREKRMLQEKSNLEKELQELQNSCISKDS